MGTSLPRAIGITRYNKQLLDGSGFERIQPLRCAQPPILQLRLNLREAKPNGSNQKVTFQFIVRKQEQQDTQHVRALQAELQFVIFAKEIQRKEVQSKSVEIC
jgi:hypothetical protein